MENQKSLVESWSGVLDHKDVAPIQDSHKKAVVAQLLENTKVALRKERTELMEAGVATTGDTIGAYEPILISMVRRAMPNLIAFDVAGVQTMKAPSQLIFAMKSRYNGDGTTDVTTADAEALHNEADTAFAGTGTHAADSSSLGGTDTTPADGVNDAFSYGTGMTTASLETLGNSGNLFNQMGFTIETVTATAVGRGLRADYSIELAQDLKAVHGLEAETELANILSGEILAEMNREMIRTINEKAKLGAASATTPGIFDLSADADGRWAVEKFKSLLFQLDIEANSIAKDTRRGKGNNLLCSSNVASALAAAGVLDYAPALSTGLNVDDTGNTFAGVINGRMKVFVDPYSTVDYATLIYRGSSQYDAGLFYCPYVPLTVHKTIRDANFQPSIGFKTRYALQQNPFVGTATGVGTNRSNSYFRIFGVSAINVA
jgi:hypothetical protein